MKYLTTILIHCLLRAKSSSSSSLRLDKLNYKEYPTRDAETAAIIEWGHSAIISALDASVAQFGPQTDEDSFFEVEGMPILADPIDGYSNLFTPGVLRNSDEVAGNVVVMTNNAGMSGVEMALVAKNSGATALIVVNTDPEDPDFIYSLKVESGEEEIVEESSIDIPIVMISLSSGNVLTSVNVELDEDGEPVGEQHFGMPEIIRLYAGAGRPFFEDVSNDGPVLYLIHHLLTDEECDSLVDAARGRVEDYDGSENLLEGTAETPNNTFSGLERTYLWKGMLKGQDGKAIEERMEQVTAFPKDHFSDFQVNKYNKGGNHKPRIDQIPSSYGSQMVSIYVFLNDDYDGGEVVYHTSYPPVKIKPRKGMAIVHHNIDQYGEFDITTTHAELPVVNGEKWTAKKWVYTEPLPPARRIAVPLFASPFGGKLPSFIKSFHNMLVEKFGTTNGGIYFNKLVVFIPLAIVLGIAALIEFLSRKPKTSKPKLNSKKTDKKRRKKRD